MKRSIDNIYVAASMYDPAEHNPDFESVAATLSEDRTRASRLRRQAAVCGEPAHRPLRQLARRITVAGRGGGPTMASAQSMRQWRRAIVSQLWALVERTADMQPQVLTLFLRGWEVPAGGLHEFDPRRRLAALRSLLNRLGGLEAGGYLIAFVHGEYEPRRDVYPVHLHILAAGGLLKLIDEELRDHPLVVSIQGEYGVTDWVRQRLRIERDLTNLPSALGYLIKSYWVSCWQGFTPEGKLKRARTKQRLPEPQHSEVLEWLDRSRPRDLAHLMNLSIGRDGFVLSPRAYTNGGDE